MLHALTEHDFDPIDTFAEHHDLKPVAAVGRHDLDFFVVHAVIKPVCPDDWYTLLYN